MLNKRLFLQIATTLCLIVGTLGQPSSVGQASKLASNEDRQIPLSGSIVRYSSPVLANLDADDDLEIVVGGSDGRGSHTLLASLVGKNQRTGTHHDHHKQKDSFVVAHRRLLVLREVFLDFHRVRGFRQGQA